MRQSADFSLKWGVLLQLGDGLQDVREDLQRGSIAQFWRATAMGGLATQLLSFSEQVGARMDRLPHGSAMLKDLLRMSWRSLIVGAVADSQQFFLAEFLQEIENNSPFRFGFLRARRTRLASREGLCSKLFNAFLEPPDDGDLDADQLVVRFGQLLVVLDRGSNSKSTDQT